MGRPRRRCQPLQPPSRSLPQLRPPDQPCLSAEPPSAASRPPRLKLPCPAETCWTSTPSPSPTPFGRTEVIDNTLNPDFVRKFVLDYFFEEKQNLRFDVYNVDSKTNISKPDFLGQAFLALGEVIGGQGSRVERPLTGVPGKKCGTILLTAEELSNCRDIATMQLCANKLDKKDFFGKSDPFLVFYRSNEDGTFTICHKTEVVKNTLNPVWQPFSIPVRALCNGDYDRTVKIDVYDWDRDGSHDFIGEFTTSYRELSKAQNQFTVYEVLNPRKKCKKKKYVNSGTVTLLSFSVDSEFTFVDYIKGGTQLNFTVAIDFTASNGNPLQPTSLHYMSPYQLSAYAMALKAVGEIIQDYDSDKLFPAYGFGAKLPPEGRISHQFPLNNNDEDPNCAGIEGVLESYFQSLRTVQLYGPTYFAPVINQVARAAAKISDGSQYYVLLIITDGVISDMTQTKEAIVSASSLPMSIIIVGVGPAMFEVCPIPRLCRPVGEPGAEHGPTCQGCAGGDPRAATVLYAHQGHPASPATPCHHQPNASSRASLNSPRNQRPAVCPPAHPLLLLKIRGTWNLGPHWEGNLEDQYWLVEPSAPSPTEGPGTVTTSLPSCQ
ncbi:copine-9 isoform X2 [Bos javanicus]|uniref:copine-9 isoform X2 n=1 Tax=Bos javanicus TaxID=9906 RepID=UPI002AA62A91|nr:copine-9 isoform X2 [Bos javanicus]